MKSQQRRDREPQEGKLIWKLWFQELTPRVAAFRLVFLARAPQLFYDLWLHRQRVESSRTKWKQIYRVRGQNERDYLGNVLDRECARKRRPHLQDGPRLSLQK